MIRRILIADSDEAAAAQIANWIGRPDRPVKMAPDATTALECLVEGNFALLLLDPRLGDISGTELIRELKERRIGVTIVLLLRERDWGMQADTGEIGAYDSLRKPVDPAQLGVLVERALSDRALIDEVDELRRRLQDRSRPFLVARGVEMTRVMSLAEQASRQQAP